MNDERKKLRAQAKEVRAGVKSGEKDEAITRIFCSSPFLRAKRFFVYLSAFTEVDTGSLIARLHEADKTVCLPRITDEGGMSAVKCARDEPFTAGRYGILQPKAGADTPCEVVLIPLLCADLAGNRLGYGGGYYDRYLKAHPQAVRVGVCYRAQIFEQVPAETWDEPLDYLLCEEGVLPVRERTESRVKLCVPYDENLT